MSTVRSGLRELTGRKNRVLAIWRLKGCPRCRGDMVLDRDKWGSYEQCIQCGYLLDVPNAVNATPSSGEESSATSSH